MIRKRHEDVVGGVDRVEAGAPRKRGKKMAAQKARAGRIVKTAIQRARRIQQQEKNDVEGVDVASDLRMLILEMPRSRTMRTQEI